MWYGRDYAVSYDELKKDMGDALSVSLVEQDAGLQDSQLWFQNFMAEVLREVSVSHPEHKFVVTGVLSTKSRSLVAGVSVRVKNPSASSGGLKIFVDGTEINVENVGLISVQIDSKTLSVRFENNRIARTLKNGRCINTSNLNRAKKVFGTYFHPTTLAERMTVPRTKMQDITSRHVSVAHGVNESFFNTVGACMLELSRTNPEEFMYLLERIGSTQKEAEDWLTKLHEADILMSTGVGPRYIHTSAEEVVIVAADGRVIDSYPQSKLPKTLATKLGLMRAAGDKLIVREVGMRYDDNNFILVGEYEDE